MPVIECGLCNILTQNKRNITNIILLIFIAKIFYLKERETTMFNFLMKNNLFSNLSKRALGFLVSSIFLCNFVVAQDACDMPLNSIHLTEDGAVWYNVDSDIAGFQFSIDGGATVSGGSGGDAATAGFVVQGAGTTVLGFSFTGSSVTAGCGTLTNLALSGTATGLSSIVFSDKLYYESKNS